MLPDDMRYYQRRAREEREPAERAADSRARHVHQRIATEYERLVDRDGANEPDMVAAR